MLARLLSSRLRGEVTGTKCDRSGNHCPLLTSANSLEENPEPFDDGTILDIAVDPKLIFD
ncbi:MAG: hypothetical protein LH649_03000 [Pseudanabaena sp. CAN_BIN31]|nr:hypothetical protein [Pseudanabaena sp. CAN_BIN31]